MDSRKINPILMRAVAVLLMLVLVTSGMVSGRFARYVTTATYEDSARVAKFNIIEEGAFTTQMRANIIPGSTEELICVKNYSEVAVQFTVTVHNVYHNIPLDFEVKDGNNTLTKSQNADGTVTFTGEIGPGQQERSFRLVINWPIDETNINYCGRVDLIRVTLDAVQID